MTHSSLPISSSSTSTCSSPSFAQSTSTIWIQSTSSMSSQTHYIVKSGIIATSARSMTSDEDALCILEMHQQECISIMATSKASLTSKTDAENCINSATSSRPMTSAERKRRCITECIQKHRRDARHRLKNRQQEVSSIIL